jgi:hypothetical protein
MLVRQEIELAKAQMTQKGKRAAEQQRRAS